MKEEEARTKWCPHAFAVNQGGYSLANRSKCMASDCMMWVKTAVRWHFPHGKPVPSDAISPEDAGGIMVVEGYCGLVKP